MHDFIMLNALRDSETTRAAISLATAEFRGAFTTTNGSQLLDPDMPGASDLDRCSRHLKRKAGGI